MNTHNLCFEQKYEKYQIFLYINFHFLVVKFTVFLNRHVFVMICPTKSQAGLRGSFRRASDCRLGCGFDPGWVHQHSTMPASVAQLDLPSDCRPGGRGFNSRQDRQHSFVEIDHEIFSTVILSLPLIQEWQLSVSGERTCTILVNRLGD